MTPFRRALEVLNRPLWVITHNDAITVICDIILSTMGSVMDTHYVQVYVVFHTIYTCCTLPLAY